MPKTTMKRGASMENDTKVEFYARCPKHPKKELWIWRPSEIVKHGGECEECGGEPELCGVAIGSDQKTCDTLAVAKCQLGAFEGMIASACDRGAISKDVAVAHIRWSKTIRGRIGRLLKQGV